MPVPMLACSQLGRAILPPGSRHLIQDVSFELERGEVMAVIGASGSGKSTLLRLLNRLDEPTDGAVQLHGDDTRTLAPRELRRRMGMVMQRAYLFPGTVAENVAFGPRQHGQTIANDEIDALLARVGLAGYASRDALTLSGGEAQRVAVTRALANTPEVLLLDEPTSALDDAARLGVQALLESLIREQRLTCVWVTHSIEQARAMADKALALESGRVRSYGPAAEVLRA